MAAYAALVSLLNNIHAITNHPTLSTSLDNKYVHPLVEKTNVLLEFIEGNNYGGGSKEVQDLETQITSAAHKAEDVIESHIVDQIYAAKDLIESNSVDQIHQDMEQLPTHLAGPLTDRSKESLDLQHIVEDMDAIIKEANQFKEEPRLGVEQQPINQSRALTDSGESAMVGLDAELMQLLEEVTRNQSSRRIISIVGMGGSGKTTLAKSVYENLLIKETFHLRAWATISQQNNTKEILSHVLSSLGERNISGTLDDLGVCLHKTLYGRRYLILLDDIWSVTAWEEVKHFFPDNNNGSRILLTTRLSSVARDCGSSLFRMNLLDEENSWKLFREKALRNEDCPPELREVGKVIVKSCKGLALSIVVIGGLLLKSPRTLEYWKSLANHLKSIPDSKEKKESLDVLTLSYNNLPPHLKPCFLYMGVFKEDSTIRVTRIIRLWIAEGFIKQIGSQVLEKIAEGYIQDLADRNLILVRGHHKNGKLGYCGIHDLLRDLSIKISEQEEFFRVSKGGIQGIERRFVHECCLEPMRGNLPLVRSIIAQTCTDQSAEYVENTVIYRLLRVLDEKCENREQHDYENVNLRYLSYRYRDSIWKLPAPLSLMWNLQTLTIMRERGPGFSIVVAPIEFWKMRQLRHVKCFRILIPSPSSNPEDGSLMLENLQTLQVPINLRLSEEVFQIIPNIKKLHLYYQNFREGSGDGDENFWERYDDGDSSIESVRNLNLFQKLESLDISVKHDSLGPEVNMKLKTSFPSSLKKLSLFDLDLHLNHLEVIGSLPHLEVFGLYRCHELENWNPTCGQFRGLKFLKTVNCNLVRLNANASHFPVLENLHLDGEDRLEEIPLDIGDIPTLENIFLFDCSVSASVSAVKIKEDQLDNSNDKLQVGVTLYKTDSGTFNKMLEAAGLSIKNIQFHIW